MLIPFILGPTPITSFSSFMLSLPLEVGEGRVMGMLAAETGMGGEPRVPGQELCARHFLGYASYKHHFWSSTIRHVYCCDSSKK